MIVDKFNIENFKSIVSASLELGCVNVFIGANGSGKSNLLEALGVLAAAAYGRVDDESLVRRGCRPRGFFRPLFKDSSPDGLVELGANGKGTTFSVALSPPDSGQQIAWKFEKELWKDNGQEIVRRESNEKGDLQAGLAALRLAEIERDTPAAAFMKALAGYSIYLPDTRTLRGEIPDSQVRLPVGLSGGRLAEAVSELMKLESENKKLSEEVHAGVDWIENYGIVDPRTPNSSAGLIFMDKYFRTDLKPDGNKNSYMIGAGGVSEGIVYELFLGILCLHPSAPALFAIENADHGLNPLLAKHLIQAMCRWLLQSKRPKQVLMTTHNPLVLDGLPLQDERVRLFTVDRDNHGATNVRRFVISEKHQEMAAKGWTLSRMWVNKLIGGVPDV